MQTKEILKKLRKENNYSAQQVADGCSMSLGVYKKYESGERGVGTPALCKLADFYKVSTDYLLGREKPKEIDVLTRLAKEFNLSEFDKVIVQAYIAISPKEREKFVKTIEEIAKQSESTQQASEPPIIQSKPQIQQQPAQQPIVQSSPQRQIQQPIQQPNLQRQIPVQQPVSTEPPPQSQIQIDPKNPCRFTARRTDGRYESRLATPEEIEKLRLALEDSENGPKPEY